MDDVYIPLDDHGIPIATVASVKEHSRSATLEHPRTESDRDSLLAISSSQSRDTEHRAE